MAIDHANLRLRLPNPELNLQPVRNPASVLPSSRKQKRTAKQIHADLAASRYAGSYGRVATVVRGWKTDRQRDAKKSGRGSLVALVFGAGEAFQFDWSEDWTVLRGERVKLQAAHSKLSQIKAFIVRA